MTEQVTEATAAATLASAANEGSTAPDDAAQAAPVEAGEATQDAAGQPAEQGSEPEKSGEAGEKEGNTESQAETLELTAPEGFEAFADDFAAFQKDMGDWLKANPEAKTADVLKEAATRQASLMKDLEAKAVEDRNAQIGKWEKASREHPRIGGENLDRVLANVKAVREKSDATDVFDVLEQTGLGSNPVILEALSLLGERMSDSGVHGAPRATGGDRLSARYPKTSG